MNCFSESRTGVYFRCLFLISSKFCGWFNQGGVGTFPIDLDVLWVLVDFRKGIRPQKEAPATSQLTPTTPHPLESEALRPNAPTTERASSRSLRGGERRLANPPKPSKGAREREG